MLLKAIKVLKSGQVQVSGTVRLEIGRSAPVRTATSSQTDDHKNADSYDVQQARIIESNNEYAIIEIICGCGSKSHIQCNYGQMVQTQQNEVEQKQEQES